MSNAPSGLVDASLTTVVTSTVNPSTYGQSVTFRGTSYVGLAVITPSGYMDFYDGNTMLGRVPVIATSSGSILGLLYTVHADFATSSLSAGSHTITTIFRNTDLVSLTLLAQGYNQTVNKGSATTSLTSSPSSSALGQSTSLTATVTATAPASGTPTGSVTFYDGTTILGTANLDGNGHAVLNTSALGGGSHSLTAVYNGSANFNASSPSSPAVSQTVSKASSTVALVNSPTPAVSGSSVTFTATVSSSVSGSFSKAGLVTFKNGSTTLGKAQANDSGVAVFSTASLTSAGSPYSITAEYAGNANFNGSTGGPISVVVNSPTGVPTTPTIPNGNLPTGVSYGQPVTLTVHLAPTTGSGTPTGTVTFYDNGTPIGTGTVDGSGNATLVTGNLPAGDHTLTATYGGDPTYAPSNTTFLPNPFTIAQATTTLAVNGPATAPVYGQNVSFSVTISDTAVNGLPPSGTVTFKDGSTVLGTGTLINGTASFTTGSLGVGPHNITAVYDGDTNFTGNTSAALNVTVNKSSTLATVNASNTNPSFGQSVIFMAQVAASGSGSGTPTGSVVFKEGSNVLATVPLTNGAASYPTSSLTAGPHLITASYAGDANFSANDSTPFSISVDQAATTVALSSSDSAVIANTPFTLTANVTNNGAPGVNPTGTVTFKDGSTVLGTANLSNGSATYTVVANTLNPGTHNITATYAGTSDFAGATSTSISVVVNAVTATPTSSSAGSVAGSYVYGSAIPLSVSVSSTSGTPTGTVSFYDGSTLIGTADLNSGTATFSPTNLDAGNHTLTAQYNGNGNFAASSTAFAPVTVTKASTSVTVDSPTPANPTFGDPITVTAHLTTPATGGNPPSGTVNIKEGSTVIGTASVASDGTVTFSTSALGAGSHTLTVEYPGDGNFTGSNASAPALVIAKASTAVSVSSSAATANEAASVTFTAVVSNTTHPANVPTGTVTFKDGTTVLATVTLDANGMASYNTSSLGIGTHNITANYDGTANFNSVLSSVLNQVINQVGGVPTVSNPGTMTGVFSYGEPITLSITVTSSNGGPAPTGTVTFYDNNNNVIGTAQVDNTGKATLVTTDLDAGDHNLTAAYGGDGNYATSNTSWPTLSVEKADTSVVLTSSNSTANVNDPVTFTATLTNVSAPSAVPTGTVTFKDGSNAIGTATLVNGVATLTYSGLNSGSHTITAVYNATANFNPITSAGLSQTINSVGDVCANVTNSNDSTSCGSLRGNINDALPKLATQDVTITIGVDTVDVDSALPTLAGDDTHTLTLIGMFSTDTNTGRCLAGTSLVRTGSFTGPALSIGNRIIVKGIKIDGFNSDGVDVNGDNNSLTCMSIGVTTANTGDGVKINGNNNTLGDASNAALGNLISGNGGAGIHVTGGTNNAAYSNWVGVNADGTTNHKNSGNALKVELGGQLKLGPGNRFRN